MPWNQLDIYVHNFGHQVMPQSWVMACFLNAIDLALYCDHNEVVTHNTSASNILRHLVAKVHYYKWFNKEMS